MFATTLPAYRELYRGFVTILKSFDVKTDTEVGSDLRFAWQGGLYEDEDLGCRIADPVSAADCRSPREV